MVIKAYKRFFKNYFNFSGRSTRSDFWYTYLALWLSMFIISFIGGILKNQQLIFILFQIYTLVILIPALALNIRRLHDINKS